LENLSDSEDVNIKEKNKISTKDSLGLYILNQHKPWIDEAFLRFVDEGSILKRSGYRSKAKQCR